MRRRRRHARLRRGQDLPAGSRAAVGQPARPQALAGPPDGAASGSTRSRAARTSSDALRRGRRRRRRATARLVAPRPPRGRVLMRLARVDTFAHRRRRGAPRVGRGRHPPRACRRSPSSAWPTRRCGRRASASARRSRTPASSSRTADHREPRARRPAQGRPGLRPRRSRSRCWRASGQLDRRARSTGCAVVGELSLDGEVRAGARRARDRRGRAPRRARRGSCVPRASARARRRWSPGSRSLGVEHAAARPSRCCGGERVPAAAAGAEPAGAAARADEPDLADVRGHNGLIPALEVAAAGGHNLLLTARPAPARRCSRGGCRRSCRR